MGLEQRRLGTATGLGGHVSFLDIFRAQGKHLYWQRLADNRVVGRASGEAIEADQSYFFVRLTEMYLGRSRTLWRKFYPLVHGFTSYGAIEDHAIAGPGQLQEVGGGNLDRVLTLNARLAGPVPFKGGDVSLLVGLWSVPGDDSAKALVATVAAVAGLAGAAAGPIAQVADVVKAGVDSIFGLSTSALRLGVRDTFFPDNPLKAGYYVGIGAVAGSVDLSRLWLRDGKLVQGNDPLVARPYEENDYFVVQVERRDVRDDWPALPVIADLNAKFAAVMADASTKAADKRATLGEMWPEFSEVLVSSPYLTAAHACKIRADVQADLKGRLDALEYGNPFETKAWGTDTTTTKAPEAFDFADVPDYVKPGPLEAEARPSFLA